MTRIKVARYQGVYYRDSEQRRHNGKPDRCFDICYKDHRGKLIWEKIGWTSEGYTAATASLLRAERLRMIRHGEELPAKKKKEISFAEAWDKYFEWAQTNRRSHMDDLWRYRKHIVDAIGSMRLSEISPFDLEKIKIRMTKQSLSPQTIKHTLALIRQVFNKCKQWGDFAGDSPTSQVKAPSTAHTNRQRFLTPSEAQGVLDEANKHSVQLYEMCLLALHTGMRAGEIFNLKWGDILLDPGIIHILDAKNGRSRQAIMSEAVREMFAKRLIGRPSELVFLSTKGEKIRWVSGTFERIVNHLGLNEGVEDRRQKVVFHSLRHTFGSWLAMAGAHPRTIMELMGHSRLDQTMRYSHLAADQKKQALNDLEAMLQRSSEGRGDHRDRASETR